MATRDHEIIDIEEISLDASEELPHGGGPITTCAISPHGQCFATYSAETESVAIWSIEQGRNHLVQLFETSVQDKKNNDPSLAVSDDRSFIFDNAIYPCKQSESITFGSPTQLPKYCLNTRSAVVKAFLPGGDLVVVTTTKHGDIRLYRFASYIRKWVIKDLWTLDRTQQKCNTNVSPKRFKYFVVKDRLICQYDGHLVQWDINHAKIEVQHFCDDIVMSAMDIMADVKKVLVAVDSTNTLSALVTGDCNAQNLTVSWIDTELPLDTVYIKLREEEVVIDVNFIEQNGNRILVTITNMGSAVLWNPHNLTGDKKEKHDERDAGKPLDIIDLNEYAVVDSWKSGTTFVLHHSIMVVLDYGKPITIPLIQKSFEKHQKSLLTVPTSIFIRTLVTKYSKFAPRERITEIVGLKVRWHIKRNFEIAAYRDKADIFPTKTCRLSYFGSVAGCTLSGNDDLAIFCDIGVCILHIADDGNIEMKYFWDNDLRFDEGSGVEIDDFIKAAERRLGGNNATWPPPSFRSILCHKDETFDRQDQECHRLFHNLYLSMASPLNIVFYGKELLNSMIDQDDEFMVEEVLRTCMDKFHTYSVSHIGYLGVLCLSLPQLSEKFSDQTIHSLPKTIMTIYPNCRFVNRLHLSQDHLYAFNNKFGCQSSLSRSIDLPLRLKLLKHDAKLSSGFRKFRIRILQTWFRFLLFLNTVFYVWRMPVCAFRRIFLSPKRRSTLTLMVPLPKYCSYPEQYTVWKDILDPPASPFIVGTRNKNSMFYQTWESEAIINFKWKSFGLKYHCLITVAFISYFALFSMAITDGLIPEDSRKFFLLITVIFGSWHHVMILRQLVHKRLDYILSIWTWIDVAAYGMPLGITSVWLSDGAIPTWTRSISVLIFWLKLLMLLRPFEYFGIYIAIIIGVAREVFSFLIVLGIVVFAYAHAFFILLKPKSGTSLSTPPIHNDDPNNPWALTDELIPVDVNGTVSNTSVIIEVPDPNTNLFMRTDTALWAAFQILTGDTSSLSGWNVLDTPAIAVLLASFSFFTVIYLMNLFIGLLCNAIEDCNERGAYLAQKAEVLAEIELYYLSPRQRRDKAWFPDIIYYEASVNELRTLLEKSIKNKPKFWESAPKHAKRIAKILNLSLPHK
ncbi:2041_t:CDS:2 [Paraglomus occultum]|uniref:2041_t:CDS:1 n=1 Tax=Paraglomus occultum TaxID=144539 RepID=A0A9N8ZMH7_9GLOM|nr:2041_t:CDS:2 [Paraglomus occultum]